MTRRQSYGLAASLLSVLASVTSLIISPEIKGAPQSWQLIALAVASISFYVIFSSFFYMMERLRHRKLLGRWYYSTKPYDNSSYKDGNFAVMRFFLNEDLDVEYSVELYPTINGLKNFGSEPSRGGAVSKALHHNVKSGHIDLVFSVRYATDDAAGSRDGRLSLQFKEGGILQGDWTSEVSVYDDGDVKTKRELSSGTMFAARPDRFFGLIEQVQGVQEDV